MSDWTDRIVGARMKVDGTFADEVDGSGFSRQEWGLVMTSVEFEIEDAGDPTAARLVANTDDLEAVVPELERVSKMQAQMQGGQQSKRNGGGGILGSLRDALGFGSDEGETVDEERVAEARRLAQRYADELQSHLESRSRWVEVCEAAAASQRDPEA